MVRELYRSTESLSDIREIHVSNTEKSRKRHISIFCGNINIIEETDK